jgi:hypothetical protein
MKWYMIATCMLLLLTNSLPSYCDSARALESAPTAERRGTGASMPSSASR